MMELACKGVVVLAILHLGAAVPYGAGTKGGAVAKGMYCFIIHQINITIITIMWNLNY